MSMIASVRRALLEDDIKRNGWSKEYADNMRMNRQYIERWDAAARVAVSTMVEVAFKEDR